MLLIGTDVDVNWPSVVLITFGGLSLIGLIVYGHCRGGPHGRKSNKKEED